MSSLCTEPGLVLFVSRSGLRLYRQPREILTSKRLEDVRPALKEVERAASAGRHAAGFMSYEAGPAFDSAMAAHEPPAGQPLFWFGLYESVELRDAAPEISGSWELGPWRALMEERDYVHRIARIRDYIKAGDIYQANFTFPLRTSFSGDPLAWFLALARAQRADHCAYVDAGRWKIASASPELFFRLDGETIWSRPMKGTAARGRWPEEDAEQARRLVESEKDRAENVMIVDLIRNDLGRIARIGSVRVEPLFEAERYPTVWQMTSTVRAQTQAPLSEVFAALFPCGSVTGAPKIRAMEIIKELEPWPRGVYCGAVGWTGPGRQAEFNVAIRTATVDVEQQEAAYHVGGGITWGSSPEGEYEECLLKARVLSGAPTSFKLLETLRFDGEFFLLQEHLDRLEASAAAFDFACDRAAVEGALRRLGSTLAAQGGSWRVRLLLDEQGAVRLEQARLGPPIEEWTARLARNPVDSRDRFLYHKTTHRAVYEAAYEGLEPCDEVVLWNRQGELTETTRGNLVLEREGRRLTPPVRCGLLPGVYRRRLLEAGAIEEAVLATEDLLRAERAWTVNSVREWAPLRLLR